MLQNNLSGSYTAIAGIIIAIAAHFGFTLQVTDVITVIAGVITLIGIVKQMVDHTQAVTVANSAIASARMRK